MSIPVYVLTNDKHLWLLRGFFHQWSKYWGEDTVVRVFGFNPPSFDLPPYAHFFSLGPNNYPAHRWTDALREMTQRITEPYFMLLLEDYWLTMEPNMSAIHAGYKYMHFNGYRTLRLDLSGDRAAHPYQFHADWRGVRIIRTPHETPYQMSFQAAIWNRALLHDMIVPIETPWEAEIKGSRRFAEGCYPNVHVIGLAQKALFYEPVWRSKTNTFRPLQIPREDLEAIRRMEDNSA